MAETRLEPALMRRALEEAALEVLETMCFEYPVDEAREDGPPEGEVTGAVARFEGSLRGELRVALSGGAPRRLAAAFLGIDEEEVRAQDELLMAAELANMLCGATMSRLEPQGRLRIAAPEASHGRCGCTERSWVRFPLEQGEMAVTLCCEEEA
ncbi:MAG: chemotaxis protein CheX [Bryobacteraceae bacterium]|nr:chemotaxis protein CheX [Bryobacteraceae bacterium]MCX7604371.1 chemotaxis protein CheX [Bryobacteraceae bacterium]